MNTTSAPAAKKMSVVLETPGRVVAPGAGGRVPVGGRGGHGFVLDGAHLAGEVLEELVGDLLRRRVDQARADLRQLAADVGFHLVRKLRFMSTRCLESYLGSRLSQSPPRRPGPRRRANTTSAA